MAMGINPALSFGFRLAPQMVSATNGANYWVVEVEGFEPSPRMVGTPYGTPITPKYTGPASSFAGRFCVLFILLH
jgi:hypothetical protein